MIIFARILLLISLTNLISTGSSGKPVQIATYEDGSLKIDHMAIENLLGRSEIQGKPISVISIAGSRRTGKSFLMNFFLRYLRKNGGSDWLGGPQKLVEEGFQWKGGSHPHTKGIVMWDEYLTIKKKNGEEVLVLLVDTQGLFDHESSKETNVKLFTFSVISSSVQILNIMRMIEERDLENLQLLVEFAVGAGQTEKKAMQLQNLMMLIRNWPHEQDHSFGLKGGRDYLIEILERRDGLDTNNNVRQYLLSAFDELECYLMPHPGLNVTSQNFNGANSEIDPDSLLHTESFVEHILSPDNLVVKRWNDKPMMARELLSLILSCDEAFESGKLPRIENMLQANAKAHHSIAKLRSLNKYGTCMKDSCNRDKYISIRELEEKETLCEKESITEYETTSTIGSDEIRKGHYEALVHAIQREKKLCRDSNELQQARITEELEVEIRKLITGYQQKINQHLGERSIPDVNLAQYHVTYSEQALSSYKSRIHDQIPGLENLEQQLMNGIEQHYNQQKKVNDLKIQKEKVEAETKRLEAEKQAVQHSSRRRRRRRWF